MPKALFFGDWLQGLIIFAGKVWILMYKISFLIALALVFSVTTANSQIRRSYHAASNVHGNPLEMRIAVGDTLFYFDGKDRLIIAPDDTADFVIHNSDLDSLNPANPLLSDAFMLGLFSDKLYDLLPGDNDTAWFMGATSWFNPSGKADNWYVFGPISIPFGGADLSWYHRHNPGFTDSYTVYISEKGPIPYSDIHPDSIPYIFHKPQISYPNIQPATDTLWGNETVQLHAFAGKKAYVAFNHDATDGDMLYLDNILVTENNNIGISEHSRTIHVNVYPNPALDFINIELSNQSSDAGLITIQDLAGRVIIRQSISTSDSRIEISHLAPGLYLLGYWEPNADTSKVIFIKG